jgi:hypothetical protein
VGCATLKPWIEYKAVRVALCVGLGYVAVLSTALAFHASHVLGTAVALSLLLLVVIELYRGRHDYWALQKAAMLATAWKDIPLAESENLLGAVAHLRAWHADSFLHERGRRSARYAEARRLFMEALNDAGEALELEEALAADIFEGYLQLSQKIQRAMEDMANLEARAKATQSREAQEDSGKRQATDK